MAYNCRGLVYSRKGDLDRAIADFNEAIRLDPKRAWPTSTGAMPTGKKGDLDRAIADFNEALRLDPKLAMAYNSRGFAYTRRATLTAPSPTTTRPSASTRIRPGLHQPGQRLLPGRATWTAPSPTINEALRLDPKLAMAYNNRGFAYSKKGDLDRAIADFDEAIRLDPKYALAYLNRGNAYYRKGDQDRAIADYNEAIRLDPKLALAYYNRGIAY